jgi:hypothetical protein
MHFTKAKCFDEKKIWQWLSFESSEQKSLIKQ